MRNLGIPLGQKRPLNPLADRDLALEAALLQHLLVEPGALDRHRSLGGEGHQQLHVLLLVRLGLVRFQVEGADHLGSDPDRGHHLAPRLVARVHVSRIGRHVRDDHALPGLHAPPDQPLPDLEPDRIVALRVVSPDGLARDPLRLLVDDVDSGGVVADDLEDEIEDLLEEAAHLQAGRNLGAQLEEELVLHPLARRLGVDARVPKRDRQLDRELAEERDFFLGRRHAVQLLEHRDAERLPAAAER